ncbi:hypothetical protein [Roseateles sp. LKC17W]|uniref:Helix-turn-helix domain-containing protein n=1 Tax=Pelomonas margarita TaxID=3299031 RepID=A0ABW7FGH2_9BURK
MKQLTLRAVKAARQTGAFLLIHEHEAAVLDALPGWMWRLFTVLLRASNYDDGQGETSYSHLLRAMTPLQPRSGPRHFVPDVQAIRKAVKLLEDRRILARDKRHSIDEGRLFFVVAPRYAVARPQPKLEQATRTGRKAKKPNADAGSEAMQAGTRTANSNSSPTGNSFHLGEGELSTNFGPQPPVADSPPGPIVLDADSGNFDLPRWKGLPPEGGKIGPPRGPDTRPAGAGHAPPVTLTTRAMQARMAKAASAPQGGGKQTPPGSPTRRRRRHASAGPEIPS